MGFLLIYFFLLLFILLLVQALSLLSLSAIVDYFLMSPLLLPAGMWPTVTRGMALARS